MTYNTLNFISHFPLIPKILAEENLLLSIRFIQEEPDLIVPQDILWPNAHKTDPVAKRRLSISSATSIPYVSSAKKVKQGIVAPKLEQPVSMQAEKISGSAPENYSEYFAVP